MYTSRSTDGLINEYWQPVLAIRDVVAIEDPALEESIVSRSTASTTSVQTLGGLGTLAETLAWRVENLTTRRCAIPHRDIVRLLVPTWPDAARPVKDVLVSPIPCQAVLVWSQSRSGRREGDPQEVS